MTNFSLPLMQLSIFDPPDNFKPEQIWDWYQDIVFMFVLGGLIVLFSILTACSLKNKANRTIHNIMIGFCIILSLSNRVLTMLYSLLRGNNLNADIYKVQFYFNYQLPFDLLNMAILS